MKRRRAISTLTVLFAAGLSLVAWRRSRPHSALNSLEPSEIESNKSRFIDLHGIRVHVKIIPGGSPALVMLHGFVASTFTWHKVEDQLSRVGSVIEFDRPGYGLTSRPIDGQWVGANPYDHDAQADLTIEILDHLGIEQAILVGHSAGGTIATLTTLRHPERVAALVLVAPAIYSELPPPFWTRSLLDRRVMRSIAPYIVDAMTFATKPIMHRAWHDPSLITPDDYEGYLQPFHVRGWAKSMVEVARANRPHQLAERLGGLTLPLLLITGDDDHVVPTEETRRLADEVAHAELHVIADCGHIPQEERPEEFLRWIVPFIARNGVK